MDPARDAHQHSPALPLPYTVCRAAVISQSIGDDACADDLPAQRRKKRNVSHVPMVVYMLSDNEIADDCRMLHIAVEPVEATSI